VSSDAASTRPLHFEPIEATLTRFGFIHEHTERSRARHAIAQCEAVLAGLARHGDCNRWRAALDRLPRVEALLIELAARAVTIGAQEECTCAERSLIMTTLRALCPWRKGPFQVFGQLVDAEWRSNIKWARLETAIEPLTNRRVLDVGCGNGYYCLRALGAGADAVLGVDPGLLSVMQFEALRRLLPSLPVAVLPMRFEELPRHPTGFDTVFSMGVLSHRRDPLDHLRQLREALIRNGQLVLETLVISPHHGLQLIPKHRYAGMRNVWCIPSTPLLLNWLKDTGFVRVELVSVTPTTPEEQRATEWMPFHSLSDALDPANPSITVEGYPAPERAMVLAHKRAS
jgi:tRNA (mo5U34)-methyltransferase